MCYSLNVDKGKRVPFWLDGLSPYHAGYRRGWRDASRWAWLWFVVSLLLLSGLIAVVGQRDGWW